MATATREAEGWVREETLAELEDLYQHAPVGLCVLDRDLRYVRANERYARIVGYDVAGLIGHTVQEVLDESVRADGVALANKVLETARPILDAEIRWRATDAPARERIWLINVHPVERDGAVTGVMAVLQNVTSIRNAEETARERLNELEAIYRSAPVGLSFVDRDLRYLRVNQAIADMNDATIQEVVGRSYRDLSPESADVAEPFLKGIVDKGKSIRNLEVRARPPADPDAEHVYLLSMDPVRNADGEVVGHSSAVQDVTELRRAQEIASRRLEELEALYANAPVGLCYLDTDLRIIHLNPLFAHLSERPIEDQAGELAEDVISEEIARQILPQLRLVARTGEASAQLEVHGRIPGSGERVYTWVAHTHPVTSDEGDTRGIITVLQDVTLLADRRREVEAVRDRLAEAQQVAHLGSWEWNLVDDEVWWSPELYEIFGADPAQVPSYTDFVEHVHPDDRQSLRRQLERALADAEPYRVTFRIGRPDGSERLLFSAARLERAGDGLPARMVGTCLDVTEFDPTDGPASGDA